MTTPSDSNNAGSNDAGSSNAGSNSSDSTNTDPNDDAHRTTELRGDDDPSAEAAVGHDEVRPTDHTPDWGDSTVPPAADATPPITRKRRLRGLVRHRATHLVAAGLAGILIGGGTMALIGFGHGDGGHGRSSQMVSDNSGGGGRHGERTDGGNRDGGNNNGGSSNNHNGNNDNGNNDGSGRQS